jgi:tRNA pseudouridine32 synthase / 23S rRNA pseudouridine746 synthase
VTAPPIRILYQDDDYLAVDKPEGVLSISEAGRGGLPELLADVHPGKLFPVHRLDREAGGVIVFARNAAAHRHLNGEFDRRAVRKTYVVLVLGKVAKDRGRIDRPIREFGSGRMGVDEERGKPSVTDYEVAERLAGYTLVLARPATGRRHQIRVHFYSLGHPVVGDRKYGDRELQERYPRLMLHALSIEFGLPSGKQVTIEAPPPRAFEGVLEVLKKRG